MKTIGFIKMYDSIFNKADDLKSMISIPRAYPSLDKIINYLESGYDFNRGATYILQIMQ